MYYFYGSDTLFILYTNVYANSLAEALSTVSGAEPPTPTLLGEAELRSAVVVRGDTIDLADPLTAIFVPY